MLSPRPDDSDFAAFVFLTQLEGAPPQVIEQGRTLIWAPPQNKKYSLSVKDSYGRLLTRRAGISKPGEREVRIPTNRWPSGMYTVRISSKTGPKTIRLMIAAGA